MKLERNPASFKYLRDSSSNNYMKLTDKGDYDTVRKAMSTLGLTYMESQIIWNIVADGLFHLVNFV